MKVMDLKVTAFKNVYEKKDPYYLTIGQALERIKSGKSKNIISTVREGSKANKTMLPVILWSGVFKEGVDSAIEDHSGFIVIDIDHVDVAQTKNALSVDDYIFACWISPSGDGIKALVKVTNPERHRDHFRSLQSYFSKQYGLEIDSSGSNLSRACFESYDKDIVVKEAFQLYGGLLSEKAESQKVEGQKYDFTDYMKLNLAARMIRQAEDGEKHTTLLRAARLCGGYVAAGRMEEDEVVRVLEREIAKRDVDNLEHAYKTIRDGINEGKAMPIREIIDEENKYNRELLINDGDMSFISSDDEDYRWISDFASGALQLGLTTGSKQLDDHFVYKKEFVITNGHSNVGKSTFILYMMVNASVRHGWKWIIYSSENKTASTKMKLMQFAADLNLKDMTYPQRKQAYKWVSDHFTIINNREVYSYTDLLIFAEKLMKQQDVDGFFIDPYNSLRIDIGGRNAISTHEYHYEAASEMLTFANNRDIAVWLNAHAVTEAQRRKGEDGLAVAPFAEDTEGGGKFVNRCDCFLTLHRKLYSPDSWTRRVTEFHVRKVREVETGGQPTPIDNPLMFEMNPSHTSFALPQGGKLFNGIFTNGIITPIPFNDISKDIF